MTCQKFCVVSGGNLMKLNFSFRSREAISFFIMLPSCLPHFLHFWEGILFFIMPPSPVWPPLNFWSLCWVKLWVEGITKIGPTLGYCLMRPYFGNALNLGLYLNTICPAFFCYMIKLKWSILEHLIT